MSEKITLDSLKDDLATSSAYLQCLPERVKVDYDVFSLFDQLAKEHHTLFSKIIQYLEQNQ